MKHITAIFILLSGYFALAKTEAPRVLENEIAKVSLSLHERPVAEPVSKPKEIHIDVECKKGFKQIKKSEVLTVCSADLQAKTDIALNGNDLRLFHYSSDPVKTNKEQNLFCDTKTAIKDTFAISDFCQAPKK